MTLTGEHTAAFIVAVCFSAGLNLPGTIATLGLLARAGAVVLPAPIDHLANGWVIAASLTLFALEFVADKVAGLDLVWNLLQTFVRAPAGALLAWAAAAQLSPTAQALAALVGGAIALAAHGGKLAVRGAVSTSPEPFSNIVVSAVEDGVAIALTWFATTHPYLAAGIAISLLALLALTIRLAARAIRRLFGRPAPAPRI